jgi:uncharacterized repeat protein (TIGR01451 family)
MSRKQTQIQNKKLVFLTTLFTTFVVGSGLIFYSPSNTLKVFAVDVVNSATVAGPTQDPTPANNTSSVTNPITYVSDLGVTIDDTLTNTTPNTQSTYTVTIKNNGPSTVTSLKLNSALPSQLQNPVVTTSAGTFDGATGNISGITLASGQSMTVTIKADVKPSATGTISYPVTVEVPAGVTDPTPANNTATDTTNITAVADLSLAKVLTSSALVSGANADYTLTVTNNGPSDSAGPITITDTLPAGLTYVSAAGTGWTCNAAAQVVTCTNPSNLANQATSAVIMTVKVD